MTERVFLGWDQPFLGLVADWLLQHSAELPRCLVLVPTSQGGRRLREALAEKAGALLAPKIMTPGAMLRTDHPAVAATWAERVAWLETLERITDWSDHAALFPQPPEPGTEWAAGMAGELTRLRHSLQENGLTLAAAARILTKSVEGERWQVLANLEKRMELQLREWGYDSRSQLLAAGIPHPRDVTAVVLAGVTDMPPLLERSLETWGLPVTALIAAPANEADGFSPLGRPLPCWAERTMPWPDGTWGSVKLVADHRQEAAEALRLVAERQTPSNEVALGSTDTATGDELARAFTRGGWPAFHPASRTIHGGLARWLRLWRDWLSDPRLAVCADLLSLPPTAALTGGTRAAKAWRLAGLRDSWMVMRPDDLRHRIQAGNFRSDSQRESAVEVLHAVEALENARHAMLRGDFPEAMQALLQKLSTTDEDCAHQAGAIDDWLMKATPLMRSVRRDAVFWLGLLLEELPTPAPQPPDGRVLDVQGWLELLLEPGSHLVLCGMNEGKLPARLTGDPWLGENARRMLGLPTDASTAARDAFLYQALLMARRHGGRVDLLCAKTGAGGEPLMPSRLLLAAPREDLPQRVEILFQDVEPPDAGLRWHRDWQWTPRKADAPQRLPVTSLPGWLACPFRFYLRQVLGMQAPEPDRIEWNARNFGTILHDVLERWGRDAAARELTDENTLREWLHDALEHTIGEWFTGAPPLAIRLQSASMRQRLAWFAREQVIIRAEGWETIEVETKFEIPTGESVLVGKIDRIDRHATSEALRVIDYKTGSVASVADEHRRKIIASTRLPAHIPAESPVVYQGVNNGKPGEFRWTNLQLPLYAASLHERRGATPMPCYFTLGTTASEVKLCEWPEFSEKDLQAASECAAWIASQIRQGVFWPPAEAPRYDDFTALAAGRSLQEMCVPPSLI